MYHSWGGGGGGVGVGERKEGWDSRGCLPEWRVTAVADRGKKTKTWIGSQKRTTRDKGGENK